MLHRGSQTLSDAPLILRLDIAYAASSLYMIHWRTRGACVCPWFMHSFYWATAPATIVTMAGSGNSATITDGDFYLSRKF